MVPYFLDFHKNIRFSKVLSEYQEQSYPTEKITIVFLNLPCNIRRIFMEQPRNIPIFNVPEHFFEISPVIFLGIFCEYTGNIPRGCSTNIPRTYICLLRNSLFRKVTTFVKSFMFDVWNGSTSLYFLKNLKLNRLTNVELQHNSNSVTKGYALFINMEHKHGLYPIFHAWTMK